MKKIKLTILGCCLLGWGSIENLHAQSNTVACGGDISGGGSISFSIGQIDYMAISGNGGIIIQGLQQPYEAKKTDVTSVDKQSLSISVYPNPAEDFIIVNIAERELTPFTYQLFDMQGRLISMNKLKENKTRISLSCLAQAGYFLKVLKNSVEIKTFKITKTK